jgi:hypothetical protein
MMKKFLSMLAVTACLLGFSQAQADCTKEYKDAELAADIAETCHNEYWFAEWILGQDKCGWADSNVRILRGELEECRNSEPYLN